MQIHRSRTLRFTIAKYEHIETTAGVTVDLDELGLDAGKPADVAQAVTQVNELLDQMQQADIDRADEVSLIDEDETALHGWKDSL